MIGIGPFITIPVLMAALGGPQAMLGWVVGLVIACADGLVWLRRRQPELARPLRMWLYPLPALIALIGWLFLFATTDAKTVLYALATLVAGIGFYVIWSRWTRPPRRA